MPERECLSDVAKVEITNILGSWLFKKVDNLEKFKQDETVNKEWLKAFETRLTEVKKTYDEILDFKTCPDGHLPVD